MNQRITAIDSLRGLAIIIMILGHVRIFFAPLSFDPIQLEYGLVGPFLTRVAANLCAPIFFFLSGMSIYLMIRKHNNLKRASRDLLIRGCIIIILDLVWVSTTWTPVLGQYTFVFSVLWALGVSMIILSVLIHLSVRWAAIIAIVSLIGHNILDYYFDFSFQETLFSFFLMLFHGNSTAFAITPRLHFYYDFAIVPWFAVMIFGYLISGHLLSPNVSSAQRQIRFFQLGIGLLILFVMLRIFLGYGDLVVWAWQNSNVGYSLLSLFAMTKNPPSLQYLSFGIGIACLLLVLFDRYQFKITNYLLVYGRTPLFLYIIHIPILNAISWIWHTIAFGGRVNESLVMVMPLINVYLIWLALLFPLYFLCKWYQPKKLKYI